MQREKWCSSMPRQKWYAIQRETWCSFAKGNVMQHAKVKVLLHHANTKVVQQHAKGKSGTKAYLQLPGRWQQGQ